MAETAYFQGSAGAVWEMSLPLPEAIAYQVGKGMLTRCNEDGSPWRPAVAAEVSTATMPVTERPAPNRPAVNDSKADWVSYAVHLGMNQADAINATKADLISTWGNVGDD